jgi:hypothetical protein
MNWRCEPINYCVFTLKVLLWSFTFKYSIKLYAIERYEVGYTIIPHYGTTHLISTFLKLFLIDRPLESLSTGGSHPPMPTGYDSK